MVLQRVHHDRIATVTCMVLSLVMTAWTPGVSGLSSPETTDSKRRALLSQSLLVPTLAVTGSSPAVAVTAPPSTTAVVTHRVFFDVRISRQDGTFYVRDDLPDTPENKVYRGRLTLNLYGRDAPNHVKRFLQYVTPSTDEDPSYSRSVFSQFDDATGVLYGGTIPSLTVTEFQGGTALRYGGRIVPAPLWLDPASPNASLSHTRPGLLTHTRLDATPRFGLTTRRDELSLDKTHTIFGALEDNADATAFLQRVSELPTYSIDRRPVASEHNNNESSRGSSVVNDAASAVFKSQRDFFRGAAQTFGDDRVGKLYDGKLLRRVEVTQVGLLK